MDDKALAALVEKAKVKKQASAGDDASEDEADDNEADDEQPSEDEESEPEEEPESASEGPTEDEEGNDERGAARARAWAWAERAVVAGKLVKKPHGKKGESDPAYLAQRAEVAKSLVAGLKLPGELFLVRCGGTRKGAGTFYTRPQLTLPTVRRTLEPLVRDAEDRLRNPEEILGLKVCDPAMGSGSFLVAALRILTAAVIQSLHEHGRVTKEGELLQLRCELLPEADRAVSEDRLESLVRRMVVEHCLYGVDIDPLAVELARVALWIETLDKRLPFTFLDHKLRIGDSLIGAWLDRFRDYPLLAWWRRRRRR